MPRKTLQDWLDWLETLSPREIVLGLERVHEVLGRLRWKRPPYVVHVAGTNGKGSCAAMLETVLRSCGARTGCYTSPHLVRYNERISVNGAACSDEEIVATFEQVEAARGDTPLTYFEFGTLAALLAFQERDVSAAILEIGMGGRLDAVNAIESDGGIITNISLDHCAWLGDDVESIAAEKAGIMRRDKPLIFGSRDVPAAILEHASNTAAELWLAGRDYDYALRADGSWDYRGANIELDGLVNPLPAAEVQVQNAAAVLAVLEATGKKACLTQANVNNAISALELPGRLQLVQLRHRWLLDVAHNAAASRVLANALPSLKAQNRLTAIVSVLGDKDVAEFAAPLCPHVDHWIAVGVDAARARPATEIAQIVANSCGKACLIGESLAAAMIHAEALTGVDDLILVTGSFYVVGPVLDELYSRRTVG